MEFVISRMEDERHFFMKILENEDLRLFVMNEMKEEVYYRAREQ